jgi:uncharacterized protein DUF397
MLDMTSVRWRKSSHSGNTTDCVEVAMTEREIGVRDTKNPTPTLSFETTEWTAFLSTIGR